MRFYVLKNPARGRQVAATDFSAPDIGNRADAPRCPVCGGATAMRRLLPPVQAELELWGWTFGDIAYGAGNEFLISEDLKKAYEEAGLTGLTGFMPVKIIGIKTRKRLNDDAITPRYFAVRPVQSRAIIDDHASGMIRNKPWTCDECRVSNFTSYRAVVLEPGTWPGEDVFFARGLPGTIIVSQRFKDLCDAHRFRNCLFIPAERYSPKAYYAGLLDDIAYSCFLPTLRCQSWLMVPLQITRRKFYVA